MNPAKLHSRKPTKHPFDQMLQGSLSFSRERSTEWLHCHLDRLSRHLPESQGHATMKEGARGSNVVVPAVAVTVEIVTTFWWKQQVDEGNGGSARRGSTGCAPA